MPSFKAALTSAALAYLANAKTIKITATSDNTFDPDSIDADKNDVLEFHFEAKNHSVVAGDYQYPCSPLELGTGFFSGFVSTDDGTAVRPAHQFALVHTDLRSRPLTSRAGQGLPSHCQRYRAHRLLLFPG